jgi:hypothetical protein
MAHVPVVAVYDRTFNIDATTTPTKLNALPISLESQNLALDGLDGSMRALIALIIADLLRSCLVEFMVTVDPKLESRLRQQGLRAK